MNSQLLGVCYHIGCIGHHCWQTLQLAYGEVSIGLTRLILPHCLAERFEAHMTELIERYRRAGSGIVATSATLITLVGCVALFLQSRLGLLHYPSLALTTSLDIRKDHLGRMVCARRLPDAARLRVPERSLHSLGGRSLSRLPHRRPSRSRTRAECLLRRLPLGRQATRRCRLLRGGGLRCRSSHLRAPPHAHRAGRNAFARQRTPPHHGRRIQRRLRHPL